jgi:hypothetical protein
MSDKPSARPETHEPFDRTRGPLANPWLSKAQSDGRTPMNGAVEKSVRTHSSQRAFAKWAHQLMFKNGPRQGAINEIVECDFGSVVHAEYISYLTYTRSSHKVGMNRVLLTLFSAPLERPRSPDPTAINRGHEKMPESNVRNHARRPKWSIFISTNAAREM